MTVDAFLVTLFLVLGAGVPLLGMYGYRRLLARLADGRADARPATYRFIMLMEWSLVAVFLAWWLGLGRDPGQAGMDFRPARWEWAAVALGLLAAGLLVVRAATLLRDPGRLVELRGKAGRAEPIIPRTTAEGTLFGFLSVTAGVCEEILFRGLLLSALSAAIGIWPAVAVSSALFGLGHAYQGPAGILKTGLVGLAMALLTVFGGTIWVAALLHAVIDATSGRLLAAAMEAPEPRPESPPGPAT